MHKGAERNSCKTRYLQNEQDLETKVVLNPFIQSFTPDWTADLTNIDFTW